MEVYQQIKEILNIVLYILNVLGIGKLLLIVLLKKMFPKASIKQVESFVKNTKTNFLVKRKSNLDET